MGDLHTPLPETAARVRQLLAQQNLNADQYLDHQKLSFETGVTAETIAALLAGKTTPESRETDTDTIARNRFRFLQQTRHAPHGEPYTLQELGNAIGVSRQWVHQLLFGEEKKKPSLKVAKPLADLFGQEVTFLTDTAPQALNRRLLQIIQSLETAPEGPPDPMQQLFQEYGIQGISARSTNLKDHQRQIIAGMIIGMISSNDAEGR
ncbi:hypothetical protein [Streptomyces virginiae]|uniref:hypothetical protein n=1 Tax=Streptomyces virginiae TaxID=1961 RepID=UPI00365F5A57